MKAPASELAATLCLHYQPIVRLDDGALCHVEVLARTTADNGHLLGPQTIVAAMGSADQALRLTSAIMDLALSEYRLHGLAAHRLTLAFNLPLNLLLNPDTPDWIETLRAKHGLPVEHLRFELTETEPVRDLELAAAGIAGLRRAGYLLALDDIVPTTPLLSALMQTSLGAVKLDRSVILDESPDSQAFIREITRRATANGQDIVAEGIETPAQLCQMRDQGVSHGQGFLLSPPLAVDGLAAWLAARPAKTETSM
ncbi:EAL domain-containing protein [Acidocella sp.]|uniref:EAL domain-containing protein n=1 Tax=Acidocella sp. TaxID=50710 RepID=UPI003D01057E